MQYIFRSTGQYLGFILNNSLFDRDSVYLGWIENKRNVWDKNGAYRGMLNDISGRTYVLKNQFMINPIPRIPKIPPIPPIPPIPQQNIMPIILPIGVQDGF